MRLVGAVSNQQATPGLEAAARAYRHAIRAGLTAQPPPRTDLRLPMGAIQEAALAVLLEAPEPLERRNVHALVECRLGQSVSSDTVGSFLSVAARADSSAIVRVSLGRYSLSRAELSESDSRPR